MQQNLHIESLYHYFICLAYPQGKRCAVKCPGSTLNDKAVIFNLRRLQPTVFETFSS